MPKSNKGGVSKNKTVKISTPSQKKIDFWKKFLTNSGGKVGRVMQANNKANLATISNFDDSTNPYLSRLAHSRRPRISGQSDTQEQNAINFPGKRPNNGPCDWTRQELVRNLDQQEKRTGNSD